MGLGLGGEHYRMSRVSLLPGGVFAAYSRVLAVTEPVVAILREVFRYSKYVLSKLAKGYGV